MVIESLLGTLVFLWGTTITRIIYSCSTERIGCIFISNLVNVTCFDESVIDNRFITRPVCPIVEINEPLSGPIILLDANDYKPSTETKMQSSHFRKKFFYCFFSNFMVTYEWVLIYCTKVQKLCCQICLPLLKRMYQVEILVMKGPGAGLAPAPD